ncbi:MAG: MBL fold metallo-hydrolase [Deltaproteobacteria bacterium]|nr:MBL fold metallo-hydrolase [Deltaproteobacteria bacterium]MBW1921123.1 MBL fold metallo-hydrolase [Deltaproteobacteria bacterium]
MELRILYDNEAEEGFKKGWGFSCLVGGELLFDVGADFDTLKYNMNRASVKLDRINRIFLSHGHGDHVGGIRVLSMLDDVQLFVPRSFSGRYKNRLTSYPNVSLSEVGEAKEISEGLFTTGELGRFTKEQSLIVKTEKGLTVITGCSHPGLVKILEEASRFGDVYGVVGGFHGFSKLEALEDMGLIVPCHCTVRKKEILDLYPETSMECSAGCKIEV